MKLFRLNRYVPIIKGDEGYLIGGNGLFSLDSGSIIKLNDEQEKMMQQLLNDEGKTIEELIAGFGEQTFKLFSSKGLFVEAEVDTTSIYSRNKAYYFFNNMGNTQKKLSASSVLILGAGGIGTHVAWNLCVLGVGKITLVDFDKVEESNLNRQLLYDMTDIGKIKVDVLKEKLEKINPNIEIRTCVKKIWSENDLEEIVSSDHFDLVIKSLDSPALFPLWLDDVCERHKIPNISGITVSTAPMIGPTVIPGHSARYSDFFDVNENPYNSVSGVSQSISVIMYHISSEISLEAFRLLSGKGKLKYLNCIYTEDVINGKEMLMYPKETGKATSEMDHPVWNCAVWIVMLLIILLSLLIDCIPLMLINYVICVFSPFLYYQTRKNVTKSALINVMIFFPVYAVCVLTRTDLIVVHDILGAVSAGVSVFTAFSFMIVLSQIVVGFFSKRLR